MSTPIETNTEELREVLQQVYALPNAGGGSDNYDLVIGLNIVNTKTRVSGVSYNFRNASLDDVSIEGGSLSAAAEKIQQGVPAKVALKAIHFYGDNWWYKSIGTASSVSIVSHANYPGESWTELSCYFRMDALPDYSGSDVHYAITIRFDISTGNVINCWCENV